MPRTEVYQLRLTKAEKDELASKARHRGVSIAKVIRDSLGLEANNPTLKELNRELREGNPLPKAVFDQLVAKHMLRTSKANAERLARKELDEQP